MKKVLSVLLATVMLITVVPIVSAAYENTYINTGDHRTDIVGVALTQLGYREGSNNDTKYGDWYGLPNQPWCAMFISWCARQANIPTSILKNSAVADPDYGYFNIPYYSGSFYTPKPGDLFFTTNFSHVGLVYYADGDYFYTIEGNSNNSGSSEGVGVFSLRRQINDYYFGVPNYEGPPIVSTITPSSQYAKVGDDITFTFSATNASLYEVVITNITQGVREMYTMLDVNNYTHKFTSPGLHLIEVNAYGQSIVGFESIYFEVHSGDRPNTYINSQRDEVYFPPQPLTISHNGEMQEQLQEAVLCIYRNGELYYEGSMMATGLYTSEFYEGTYEANVLLTYKSGYGIYTKTIRWHVGSAPSNVILTQNVEECEIGDQATFTITANDATEYYFGIGNGADVVYEMNSSDNTLTYTFEQQGLYYIWASATNYYGTTTSYPEYLTVNVKLPQYDIRFDANGGSGAPSNQIKARDVDLTLSSTKPIRTGYTFVGWATSPTAISAEYLPGEVFTSNANTTLYAVWKLGCSAAHVYDNDTDPTCNVCGAIREVEIPADAPAFAVDSVRAQYGNTFKVAVRTRNNPGIVGLRLRVQYDTDLLELVTAEVGTFTGTTFGPLTANPFTFTWADAIHPNNTSDDAIVWLTFRAKEGTDPTQTVISLSYDADDVYNDQWENVLFNTISGTVDLTATEPGDLNADGKVNVRDLGLLQQHLNGWEVTLDETAADVTGDGKVNVRDLGLLQQYLNGWDVELK